MWIRYLAGMTAQLIEITQLLTIWTIFGVELLLAIRFGFFGNFLSKIAFFT